MSMKKWRILVHIFLHAPKVFFFTILQKNAFRLSRSNANGRSQWSSPLLRHVKYHPSSFLLGIKYAKIWLLSATRPRKSCSPLSSFFMERNTCIPWRMASTVAWWSDFVCWTGVPCLDSLLSRSFIFVINAEPLPLPIHVQIWWASWECGSCWRTIAAQTSRMSIIFANVEHTRNFWKEWRFELPFPPCSNTR